MLSIPSGGDKRRPASDWPPDKSHRLRAGRSAKLIVAREAFACALLDDETLRCWGENNNGQVEYSTHPTHHQPAPPITIPAWGFALWHRRLLWPAPPAAPLCLPAHHLTGSVGSIGSALFGDGGDVGGQQRVSSARATPHRAPQPAISDRHAIAYSWWCSCWPAYVGGPRPTRLRPPRGCPDTALSALTLAGRLSQRVIAIPAVLALMLAGVVPRIEQSDISMSTWVRFVHPSWLVYTCALLDNDAIRWWGGRSVVTHPTDRAPCLTRSTWGRSAASLGPIAWRCSISVGGTCAGLGYGDTPASGHSDPVSDRASLALGTSHTRVLDNDTAVLGVPGGRSATATPRADGLSDLGGGAPRPSVRAPLGAVGR